MRKIIILEAPDQASFNQKVLLNKVLGHQEYYLCNSGLTMKNGWKSRQGGQCLRNGNINNFHPKTSS